MLAAAAVAQARDGRTYTITYKLLNYLPYHRMVTYASKPNLFREILTKDECARRIFENVTRQLRSANNPNLVELGRSVNQLQRELVVSVHSKSDSSGADLQLYLYSAPKGEILSRLAELSSFSWISGKDNCEIAETLERSDVLRMSPEQLQEATRLHVGRYATPLEQGLRELQDHTTQEAIR